MPYRVGDHRVDELTRAITGPDGPVHVEPQVLQVLLHLIEHRDRAVAKSELLDEIWGGQFVTESALTSRIKAARSALGDSGRQQRLIRTVHGFGYQFVGPVVEVAPDDTAVADGGPETAGAGPAPGVPGDGPTHGAWPARAADRLPAVHGPLRGRVEEMSAVSAMLGDHRLVTLLGPGGMGKTRLSVEVARRRTATDPRPHVFVDLSHIGSGDSVGITLADALAVDTGQRSDPMAAAIEVLAADPHVLLLDNCEHVWEAAAEAVAALASGAPATTVLATSRRPLGLPFERIYRLSPLSVAIEAEDGADSAGPAVDLFRDRAELAGSGPLSGPDNAVLVADICRRLDGLPLALELAAGRVATFGLPEVAELLNRRLDAFSDSSSVREQRHRTLRATVAWSYDLLSPGEQQLFRALSAFPSGIALDQVAALGDAIGLPEDPFAALASLVDASLLVRAEAASGSRFTQLETLRAFGLAELRERDDQAAVGDAMACLVLDLLARGEAGLATPDEARWADRIRREIPNIRAVRRHLERVGRTDELLLISRRLAEWARFRDAVEVWSWSDDLCRRCADGDPRRATMLALAAQAAWRRGDIDAALAAGTEALTLAEDDEVRVRALAELATARMFAGEHRDAVAAWRQQAEIVPDSIALGSAALASGYGGHLAQASELLGQSARLVAEDASPSQRAWQTYCENEVAQLQGAADVTALAQAIAEAHAVGAEFIVGVATVTLASRYAALGDAERAAAAYRDLIGHWLRSGSWTQLWTTLRNVAELLEQHSPEVAWAILLAAERDEHSSAALTGPPAERLAALRARLAESVGGEPVATDRVTVAEAARSALTQLCAGDANS